LEPPKGFVTASAVAPNRAPGASEHLPCEPFGGRVTARSEAKKSSVAAPHRSAAAAFSALAMQAVTVDYVTRASWVVAPGTYDEEEAETRSARLAGADVRESPSAPAATPRSGLLGMISSEALVVGESTVNALLRFLPARRGKPHAIIFTLANAAVLVLLFFWCAALLRRVMCAAM
jgi:hypothetical protein